MRRVKSWLIGLALGSVVGGLVVFVLVRPSAAEIRGRIRSSYADVLAEARQASADRRAELQAQLKAKRRPASQDAPVR